MSELHNEPAQEPTIHAIIPSATDPSTYLVDVNGLFPSRQFDHVSDTTYEGTLHAIGRETLGLYDLSVNRRIVTDELPGIVYETKPVALTHDQLNGYIWRSAQALAEIR